MRSSINHNVIKNQIEYNSSVLFNSKCTSQGNTVLLPCNKEVLGLNPGLRSFCMGFACSPCACKGSLQKLLINLTVKKQICMPYAVRCECVHAWLFVLCVSVLPCDGLETCPGCILEIDTTPEGQAGMSI
ncbi:hypothetical protein XENORESO_001446 [Xenotaenia resolanae]|uniref:Uncharacterized protein n=1 Tax=Xenotaenia resolanae TaxID=208358 RepID=A0ABV0X1Y3_9TELE